MPPIRVDAEKGQVTLVNPSTYLEYADGGHRQDNAISNVDVVVIATCWSG